MLRKRPRISIQNYKALIILVIITLCFFRVAVGEQFDTQVEQLLGRMTLSEKIGQMIQINDFNGEIPEEFKRQLRAGRVGSMLNEVDPETSLEIQRIAIEESRLGIPLIMARDVIHGFRTVFPIPLGQAATWDPELVKACTEVAAEEAALAGFHWTFAPMLDITRDPRWGRIAEGFGEDPYLASIMAEAMVKGFQGGDLSAPNTIAACAKHFAGYGAVEGGRDYNTASIPNALFRNVYLAPFEAAVNAGVVTVMTSFNEINGVPSSGNSFILQRILREEWGFKGFVVSDWRSMEQMIDHGFCEDMRDVALKSITAGVDMEMVSMAYGDQLEKLIHTGLVPLELINNAVRNILRIKFQLGLFRKPFPYSAKKVGKPEKNNLDLAREAALKSVVLLKNDNGVLPVSREVKSITIAGPMADDPYEVLGTWNRDGDIEDTVTPLKAIQTFLGKSSTKINFGPGLVHTRSKDKSGFGEVIKMARGSDIIMVFGGEEAILSGEAHSRAYLNLPGNQDELICELAKTGKPIVLIVLAGRPLTIGDISEKVDAVLYAWHPGTMCGPALVDLIFGIESPSGKLPVTFPKTVGQIPIYYNHKNTGRPPIPGEFTLIDDIPVRAFQSSIGNTAHYLDIGFLPLYPFGYGLSYSEFKYSNLQLKPDKVKIGDNINVSVEITNIGQMEAEEVVQLYTRDLVASLTRSVKELKNFQRIRLKPEQMKRISFNLSSEDLGFYNNEMQFTVEPGKFHLWIGPSSDEGLMTEFELMRTSL